MVQKLVQKTILPLVLTNYSEMHFAIEKFWNWNAIAVTNHLAVRGRAYCGIWRYLKLKCFFNRPYSKLDADLS